MSDQKLCARCGGVIVPVMWESILALRTLNEAMAEALQIASLELRDIAMGLQPSTGAVAAKYIESALAAYSALATEAE